VTPNVDLDIYSSSFDATIYFPFDIDLSTAMSTTLEITFLDTNVSLQDPEAFYDYSNGFEDVAIVTRSNANFLDEVAAGQAEAPLVLPEDTESSESGATIHYPSSSGYFIAAYEDLFPRRSDYDFNDLVVGYRVALGLNAAGEVISINGEGYLIARGASFNHDWHLRIPLPEWSSGSGQYKLYAPGQILPAPRYPVSLSVIGALDYSPFKKTRNLWTNEDSQYMNPILDQPLIP